MSGFFSKLASLIAPEGPAAPAHNSVALALAALMVRLARVDGSYDPGERQKILEALDHRFGEGEPLLEAAEIAEAEALDHHQFTTVVKSAFAPEERGALLEELWSVVLADGARDDEENALMRQFGSLLHVSDQDMARARHRVLKRG